MRKSLLILFLIYAGSVPGAVCEEIFTYSFSLICAGRVSGAVCEETSARSAGGLHGGLACPAGMDCRESAHGAGGQQPLGV